MDHVLWINIFKSTPRVSKAKLFFMYCCHVSQNLSVISIIIIISASSKFIHSPNIMLMIRHRGFIHTPFTAYHLNSLSKSKRFSIYDILHYSRKFIFTICIIVLKFSFQINLHYLIVELTIFSNEIWLAIALVCEFTIICFWTITAPIYFNFYLSFIALLLIQSFV